MRRNNADDYMHTISFKPVAVLLTWLAIINPAIAAPESPAVISPLEQVSTATPEFVWQNQPGATHYRLYIYDRLQRQRVHLANYTTASICDSELCSVTPDINLGLSKNHRWFVRARDAGGWGDWTKTYFDYVDTAPQIVTTIGPSGITNSAAPEFSWNDLGNATLYRLYVRDVRSRTNLVLKNYTAADICANDICALTPDNLSLPESDYLFFRVRGYNTGGWGPYSALRRFSYTQPNEAPVASNDAATIDAGDSVSIAVLSNDSDNDSDLDTASVNIARPPNHGTISVQASGDITYSHNGNNASADSFTYTVTDEDGGSSNAATVSISIIDSGLNRPPQPRNDTATVAEGGQVIINVLANDTDSDGSINVNSLDIAQPFDGEYFPNNGTLQVLSDGRIAYTHYGGPTTSDVFYYVVADNDGALSSPGVVTISIGSNSVNLPPQANNDAASVNNGQSVSIDILANDTDTDGTIDRDSITVQQASNGQVVVRPDGTVRYTHNGTAGTTDSFTYTVSDSLGETSNTATVTVSIGNSNLVPVAVDDSAQITSGTTIVLNLLANDIDRDGELDSASILLTGQPNNAAAITVLSNGTVSYTNNGNGNTTDTFRYTVRDNNGAVSNEATVTISILPVANTGEITALHRSGQTFLTWPETGELNGYHVYRHNAPITPGNLENAVKLTTTWGALDNNTSVNVHGAPGVPSNFVISDLGTPLGDNTGLFVYTTQTGDSTTAYYAVTTVDASGTELVNTVLKTSSALSESVATPSDVLTTLVNQGKGRTYTQYMDYVNWNPTFNGYAYNYAVALPASYDSSVSYPLMIELHAYYENFKSLPESEYQWPVITLLPHDPGPPVGALHSWWYGYARDHNYKTNGSVPVNGAVSNFTEQRIMRSVDQLIGNQALNIDSNKIHAYGNSMGASGAISLALRYGSLISGVYANQPMTNYKTSPTFESELVQLWGSKDSNLPIANSGPHNEDIALYGLNGITNVGVWDWMNHHKQMLERRGDTFAFIMSYHGKQDSIIDWNTQGKPTVAALSGATTGFTAVNDNSGHSWAGFTSVPVPLFGFGYDNDFAWKYPLNLSYPAIANASASSSISPDNSSYDTYNMNIEWATTHTPFASAIVDLPRQYSISLRSNNGPQTASITPRRTQQFNLNPGTQCSWSTKNNNTGQEIANGSVTVDIDSLITVNNVAITGGAGTLLNINCP